MTRLIKWILLKGVRRNRDKIICFLNNRINIPRMTEKEEEELFSILFDIILG